MSLDKLTRRKLLQFAAMGLPCNSLLKPRTSRIFDRSDHSKVQVKIWDGKKYNLALSFELPELPGEIFTIILPELLSEGRELILPYAEDPMADWSIEQNVA